MAWIALCYLSSWLKNSKWRTNIDRKSLLMGWHKDEPAEPPGTRCWSPTERRCAETSMKALPFLGEWGRLRKEVQKRREGLESNGVSEAWPWSSQHGQHAHLLAGDTHGVPAVHNIWAVEIPPVTSWLPGPQTAQNDFIWVSYVFQGSEWYRHHIYVLHTRMWRLWGCPQQHMALGWSSGLPCTGALVGEWANSIWYVRGRETPGSHLWAHFACCVALHSIWFPPLWPGLTFQFHVASVWNPNLWAPCISEAVRAGTRSLSLNRLSHF